MKALRFLLALAAGSACALTAQEPVADEQATAFPAVLLTAEQLDQLLAPIALYPDALIALILPAATVPTDLVLAARYLKENPGNLSQVEHRAWDDSVKSLTHYPDVVHWLDENLTWTKQVGEAFVAQPVEVMNSIQRLRAKARANGALASTPQQQVLAEQDVVRIVPADPEIIYVPRYDPTIVFVDRPYFYPAPLLTFGAGWRVGSWLAYDFDWRRCTLWVGDRHRRWPARHDWHRPLVPIGAPAAVYHHAHPPARLWQPPAHFRRPGTPSGPHRSHPHPPGSTGSTLAGTYGRNHTPPGPRVNQPAQSTTTTAIGRAQWLHPPAPPSRAAAETTVVAPPSSPPTQPSPVGRSRDRSYPGTRSRTFGNTATTTHIAPPAPALSVVGPVSHVRPTVVAPASARSHVGTATAAQRAQTYTRPTVSPREHARIHVAPAPQPASPPAHVAPAAAAPTPAAPAAAPASRPSRQDPRSLRRDAEP